MLFVILCFFRYGSARSELHNVQLGKRPNIGIGWLTRLGRPVCCGFPYILGEFWRAVSGIPQHFHRRADERTTCGLRFFVVSGAALSARFFQGHDRRAVLFSAMKRYPRLTLPIVVASAMTVAAGDLGILRGSEAARLLERSGWLGLDNQAGLSLPLALKFSLVGVYFGPSSESNILPFLWTMPIEMGGSIVLFAYLLIYDFLERPLMFLGILYIVALIISPFFSCFFAGIFIAAIRTKGSSWCVGNSRLAAPISMLLTLSLSSILAFYAVPSAQYLSSFLAVFVCYYSVENHSVSLFLRKNKLSFFLGNISFSIYLVHYLALNTVLAWFVIKCGNLDVTSAFLIGATTLAFAIFLAAMFRPVDKLSHSVSGWIAKVVLDVSR